MGCSVVVYRLLPQFVRPNDREVMSSRLPRPPMAISSSLTRRKTPLTAGHLTVSSLMTSKPPARL